MICAQIRLLNAQIAYKNIYTQLFIFDFYIRKVASRGRIHREEGYTIKIKRGFLVFLDLESRDER